MKPGPSLNESTGAARLRNLEDSRLNIQIQILEKLDQIAIIDHELDIAQQVINERQEWERIALEDAIKLWEDP